MMTNREMAAAHGNRALHFLRQAKRMQTLHRPCYATRYNAQAVRAARNAAHYARLAQEATLLKNVFAN